jgi:ribosomal protein S18 acetylase RimI-like enzyme
MITLTMRPYAGDADLEAIANLINTCEAVDQLDEGTSVSELQQQFDEPSLDKARDIRLWENADGQLAGMGRLWIPPVGKVIDGFLWFRVLPTARGGDLDRQIVAWAEGRMREVSQERGVQVKLRSGSRAYQSDSPSKTLRDRIALLESCGFIADRYFFTMERSLSLPIPESQLPDGFTIRQVRSNEDAEAWVELFNQSFIDHWNHHDLTVESYEHWLTDPDYKPELDLVAVAADGTFAAFCHCDISPEDNKRSGRNEGWISTLGTRRGFRRKGLGRAMLLAGMQRLKVAGVDTARLGVDTENPSGAGQLYESVGFRKVYTQIMYVKDM